MYGVRDDTRCQWVSAWPLNVQYVGGEGVWPGLMSLVSRCWCQGGARCEGVCLLRGWLRATSFLSACRCSCRSRNGSLNGCVPTRHVVGETSPCPVIVGESPVKAVSPVVPGAEASLSWCPVLPVNGLLEDKTKSPCGRGSIVVCSSRL